MASTELVEQLGEFYVAIVSDVNECGGRFTRIRLTKDLCAEGISFTQKTSVGTAYLRKLHNRQVTLGPARHQLPAPAPLRTGLTSSLRPKHEPPRPRLQSTPLHHLPIHRERTAAIYLHRRDDLAFLVSLAPQLPVRRLGRKGGERKGHEVEGFLACSCVRELWRRGEGKTNRSACSEGACPAQAGAGRSRRRG